MLTYSKLICCFLFSRRGVFYKKQKTYTMRVPQCQPFSYEMRKRNSNFQFRFSFTQVIGKRNSRFRFRFRFPTTLKMDFERSVFVFCFPMTLDIRILIVISVFRLSFSKDIEKRNLIFDFRFSFLFSISSVFYLNRHFLSITSSLFQEFSQSGRRAENSARKKNLKKRCFLRCALTN